MGGAGGCRVPALVRLPLRLLLYVGTSLPMIIVLEALDGGVFVDAGMVAPSHRNLSLRETEIGYGVGLRF